MRLSPILIHIALQGRAAGREADLATLRIKGGTMVLDVSAAANVLTSIPFVVIGVQGLQLLRRHPIRVQSSPSVAYALSLMLVGVGSAFYHWSPSPTRLLWDRLPIALCLTAAACAATGFRTPRLGTNLLLPTGAVASITVFYWYATWLQGHEDVRPWAVVQVVSTVWIVIAGVVGFGPAARGFRMALPIYLGARIAELSEQHLYRSLGYDVGHPLKHILTAWAAFLILQDLLFLPSVNSGSHAPQCSSH